MENLHLSNLSALVVSSKDGDSVSKTDLKCDKESHSLNRVVSSIDIVTHEQVVGLWRASSNLEKFSQVMELSVDVSTDCDWSLNWLHIWLVNQDFSGLFTNKANWLDLCVFQIFLAQYLSWKEMNAKKMAAPIKDW